MTIKITTNNDDSHKPRKTEISSPTPIVPEVMQHADVKVSKVLFTNESASQILLLGKGRGRCVALWERDHGLDPFQVLASKSTEVDPNDACKLPDNRVCVGYSDGSLAIYNTDKNDLVLMSRMPSVHNGCASRALCRNDRGVLSASSNGTLVDVDVESGKTRKVFSGQAGIRSVCTTFGGNVVVAGDCNGQITMWDLREDKEKKPTLEPIKTLIPSKKPLDAVSALCSHPAQSNLVCCGTDDGIVGLIDARNSRGANLTSTYLVAKRSISQLMFHPTCGDSLLVSSNDGSLTRIDASGAPIAVGTRATKDTIWLEGDLVNALRLEPIRNESIYPISSFDVHADTVVAASSIGMVSLYQQLPFFPNSNFGKY